MAFGKSKSKNTNKQSSATLGQLQAQNPKQEFSDVLGNANELFGGLTDSITSPFMDLISRGEETMADNPMMPLFELLGIGWQDEIDAKQPTAEPEVDPYEARIQELMNNRGLSREDAELNQRSAMRQGGDINNDGAVTNDEWARKLGSDFDDDGSVSDAEWAQWKKQNPDHRAVGGTKYKGLPGEDGMFAAQQPQQQMAPQQQQMAPQQPQVAPQQPQMAPQMAPQQPPQQPQMSQGMPPNGGMNPEALATLQRWKQNGGSYA